MKELTNAYAPKVRGKVLQQKNVSSCVECGKHAWTHALQEEDLRLPIFAEWSRQFTVLVSKSLEHSLTTDTSMQYSLKT